MVGLKRCALCSEVLARGDEMVKCEHCNAWCHQACVAERAEDSCPRGDHVGWTSVVEF